MSRNTTCIDGDHHSLVLDFDWESFCNIPAREYRIDLICVKCLATATDYIYSEDLSWSAPQKDS